MRLALFLLLLGVPSLASAQTCSCSPSAVDDDRVRIRAHLAEVEAELRAAPVDHLSDAQRAARAVSLDRLHEYAARGELPHGSLDQPGDVVPTFIDADGRPCAMGYLLIASGGRAIAEQIARAQLHARVPDIRHPALGPWLEANGMTVAEAARVQPGYGCPCPDGHQDVLVCSGLSRTPVPFCLTGAPCGTSYPSPECDDAGTCTCEEPLPPPYDAGPPPEPDAAPFDAAHHDAGARDANAIRDAAARDASAIADAGVRLDAAPRDAGAMDAGNTVGASGGGCRVAHGGRADGLLAALALALLVRSRARGSRRSRRSLPPRA